MGDTGLKGYTDPIGKHAMWAGDHTGPASYATGGETLKATGGPGSYGGLRSIDQVVPAGVSVSGNYCVQVQYTAVGQNTKVTLIWLYSPLNTLSQTAWTQVANATNLSGETIRLLAIGA